MIFWLIGATLLVLTGLMIVDLRSDRSAPTEMGIRTKGAEHATQLLPQPALGPDAADQVRQLAGLGAEGWMLVGPTGTLLATNQPSAVALLADAASTLRLGSDSEAASAWNSLTLEGPAGVLLGETTPHGWTLAVLARADADRPQLRAAMTGILHGIRERGPGWEQSDAARLLGAAEASAGARQSPDGAEPATSGSPAPDADTPPA